jgi:UDP-N-acetylmuramoylalanine--D-glutamate ligase
MAVTLYSEDDSPDALAEGFGVATGSWDPVLLNGVDLVVASPGFSERSLPIVEALESGLTIWSEIEFAWRQTKVPVAAVTGTNGKTTVTEAAAAMLEASGLDARATGNIGSPLSDHVDHTGDALVVEVSSFQLRFIEDFHPVAAVITNVAVDHLDWHGSEAAYRSAKARIFENQTRGDLLVYDADDAGAASLAVGARSTLFPVSGASLPIGGGGVDGGRLVVGEVSVPVDELASSDATHLTNMAAASALALRMGASRAGVEKVAHIFVPGPHRRSVVASTKGIIWVDDSKATNVHAAVSSIRAHPSVVLIAGGLAKGIDLEPIAREDRVRELVGIGAAGPELVEMAGNRGHLAGTLEKAVEVASDLARPGDTVLLAPGCASFDQFDSYETRGDQFAELARERAGKDLR